MRERLTVYGVAKRYGRSASTIYRWTSQGLMPEPHRQVGRLYWWLSDLEAWEDSGFQIAGTQERAEA